MTILESDAKYVFLGARWTVYSETLLSKNEEGRKVYLSDEQNREESIDNNRRVLTQGLEALIARLIEAGKRPILLGQVPEFIFKPSNCLFKKYTYNSMKALDCDQDAAEFDSRYQFTKGFFSELKTKYPELFIIETHELFKKENRYISMLNSTPLYADDDHINNQGAKVLYDKYKETSDFNALEKWFQKPN